MKTKPEIYAELIGLADSLDDHVTPADIAGKLRQLADEIEPYPLVTPVAPGADPATMAAIRRVRAFQKQADEEGYGR